MAVSNKIAFIIHSEVALSHFQPVWQRLPRSSFELVVKRRNYTPVFLTAIEGLVRSGIAVHMADNCPRFTVSVALHYVQGDPQSGRILPRVVGQHAVRQCYSLGDISWETDDWNRHFDSIITIGSTDHALLSRAVDSSKLLPLGLAKLDKFWRTDCGAGDRSVPWCFFSSVGHQSLISEFTQRIRDEPHWRRNLLANRLAVKRHPDCQVALDDDALLEVGVGCDSTAFMINVDTVVTDSGGSIFSAILLGRPAIRLVGNSGDRLPSGEPARLAADLWSTALTIDDFLMLYPSIGTRSHSASERSAILKRFYWNADDQVSDRIANYYLSLI